ncbi:MAG: aminopeptidase [Lachnospiraceae bacterium]|nr:aminopeptidase [Candidatus Merdinaster equi]
MDEQNVLERYNLICDRLQEMKAELSGEAAEGEGVVSMPEPGRGLFLFGTDELCKLIKAYEQIPQRRSFTLEQLKEENRNLYSERLADKYDSSYYNPSYMQKLFGEELGALLCAIINEVTCVVSASFTGDLESIVIRGELFLELYSAFVSELQETGKLPKRDTIKSILYYYGFDYSDIRENKTVGALVDADDRECRFFYDIIMNSDLTDLRYLYYYGFYITDNEYNTAKHMNELSEEQIALMADTYTGGYCKGFELAGKDLSKKQTVDVRFPVGFERMVKKAIQNFERIGLRPTMYRCAESSLWSCSSGTTGCFGAAYNKQLSYDHREDEALILDGNYKTRRVECRKEAFEAYKDKAHKHAGPAVIESFGEKPFSPKNNICAPKYDDKQREIRTQLISKASELTHSYIPWDERSFTVIAFPVPEIGEKYAEIFDEIIRINTLDYQSYSRMQGAMIDALNTCTRVEIGGKNGNETNLTVELCKLSNPDKQAIFENCVADVNIPVGEIFTSPVLKGTNGILHVSHVYLEGLFYKNLKFEIVDGFTSAVSCENFATEKEGEDYIRENILFHHDKLPMGEFAIGTNTTAYVAAGKYGIENILPILIAEKTGPHFAFGDTCYSYSEDVAVFNPDGKEIVARDNEVSLLRKSDPSKAYFDCHTDITIPYEELGFIRGVREDGTRVSIIEDGRFVLKGCEELNAPLDKKV